jgi:hypothetical protein
VKAATEPLIDEIKALRAEVMALKAAAPVPGPMGPAGPPGEPGVAVDGKDGQDGTPGKDGADAPPLTHEQVKAALLDMPEALVTAIKSYFDEHPVRDGQDGADGAPGLQGGKGDRGETGPPGPDGAPGISIIGEKGEKGDAGRDGVGLAGAVIDREGALVVTMTDGATKALGLVVGAKGADGRDGLNGMGFGELVAEHDGERTFTLKAVDGEQVKSLGTFSIPVPLYRGVYQTGQLYEAGDEVTWDGSMWIAKADTRNTPGEGKESGWQLAVKRGKQGVSGAKGERGEQGPIGLKGDRAPVTW